MCRLPFIKLVVPARRHYTALHVCVGVSTACTPTVLRLVQHRAKYLVLLAVPVATASCLEVTRRLV
jgi:hypothetical protein